MFKWSRTVSFPKFDDLQYDCLKNRFESMFKDGTCTWESPSYAVEDWLNSTREWFEDCPDKQHNCILWEYYEYAKTWLEGYNMGKNTPESLEPKTLNLPERFTEMIKTLRNNGQTYVHMLTEGTYTMGELYGQLTSWLNNVDFLRPTLEDSVFYPEISEAENVLKEHLNKFERTEAVDCDTTKDPITEDAKRLSKLGDSLYDEGASIRRRIMNGDPDIQGIRSSIIRWMGRFDTNSEALTYPKHPRLEHIKHLYQRLVDFKIGVDAADALVEQQKSTESTEDDRLVQVNHELRMEIERLEHELDSCKEHVAFLQKSTNRSESSEELHKNTLQLIKNLCTILENN